MLMIGIWIWAAAAHGHLMSLIPFPVVLRASLIASCAPAATGGAAVLRRVPGAGLPAQGARLRLNLECVPGAARADAGPVRRAGRRVAQPAGSSRNVFHHRITTVLGPTRAGVSRPNPNFGLRAACSGGARWHAAALGQPGWHAAALGQPGMGLADVIDDDPAKLQATLEFVYIDKDGDGAIS